jgi:hypothetical protein
MRAVEMAIEKVKELDEANAKRLLDWLKAQQVSGGIAVNPDGAVACLGFARRFRVEPRTTGDWMNELRSGEEA